MTRILLLLTTLASLASAGLVSSLLDLLCSGGLAGRGFLSVQSRPDGTTTAYGTFGQNRFAMTGNCPALTAAAAPGGDRPAGSPICILSGNTTSTPSMPVSFTFLNYSISLELNSSSGTLMFNNQPGTFVGVTAANLTDAPYAALALDPISLLTGAFLEEPAPDLDLGGPIRLALQRFSSSYLNVSGLSGAFGLNWRHNFEVRAYPAGNQITVATFHGEAIGFVASGSTWVPIRPYRLNYQLVNGAGGTLRFFDPESGLIYTFAASGALAKIEDRNGNALTITQGANGPAQIADGLGRTLTFTYNVTGQLTKVSDGTRSVSYTYSGANLASHTNTAGKVTTYATASFGTPTAPVGAIGVITGLISKITRPSGSTNLAHAFDGVGRVAQQVDGRNNLTTIAYSSAPPGNTTVTDPLGNVTVVTNSNLQFFSKSVDAAGRTTTTTYDANGRPTSTVDRNGNTTSVAYHDPSGFVASRTDAAGAVTSFGYTAAAASGITFHDRTSAAFADGTSETYSYDANGNLVKSVDRAGKATTRTYNSRGQLLSVTNPLGGVTTLTYNADGTIGTAKSAAGDTSTFSYDSLKRRIQIKFADGATRSVVYDALDRVTQLTDERSKVTRYTYTDNGKLQSVTDALGAVTTYSYDAAENLISIKSPTGTTTAAYNAVNLLSSITAPSGESFTTAYDKLNQLVSISGGSGTVAAYTRDLEGAIVSATNGAGNTYKIARDAVGRVTGITTPLGNAYQQSYDKLGRVVTRTDALGAVTAFGYDPRGLLTKRTRPGGIESSFAYDDGGNLTSITDPNGAVWTLTYDSMGRMTSRKDPLGRAVTYSYDSRNRVATRTDGLGSVRFTYDSAGNLTRRQYSGGLDVSYTYDDRNRLTGSLNLALIYDAGGRVINSNGIAFTRDASGRVLSIAYPAGKVTYGYNQRGQVVLVTDWKGASTKLDYDAAGRRTSITRPNGVRSQYTYDADGRLTGLTHTGPAAVGTSAKARDADGETTILSGQLIHDAIGRRVSLDQSAPANYLGGLGVQVFAYGATGETGGDRFDVVGNRIAEGTPGVPGSFFKAYSWNQNNTVASYEADGFTTLVTHDAAGRTVRTATPQATTNFTLGYDLGANALPLIASTGSANQTFRIFVPGDNLLLLSTIEGTSGPTRYLLFDAEDNPVATTDAQGQAIGTTASDVDGNFTRKGVDANGNALFNASGVRTDGSLTFRDGQVFDAREARSLHPVPVTIARDNGYAPRQTPADPKDRLKIDSFFDIFPELDLPRNAAPPSDSPVRQLLDVPPRWPFDDLFGVEPPADVPFEVPPFSQTSPAGRDAVPPSFFDIFPELEVDSDTPLIPRARRAPVGPLELPPVDWQPDKRARIDRLCRSPYRRTPIVQDGQRAQVGSFFDVYPELPVLQTEACPTVSDSPLDLTKRSK